MKQRLNNQEQYVEYESLSIYERVILSLFMGLIALFIFISIWNFILLLLNATEGGGPIGYVMHGALTILTFL